MIWTRDRIQKLWETHFGPHAIFEYLPLGANAGELLDTLDECADVDTRWKDGHTCWEWDCESDHGSSNINPLGARVALHEQLLGAPMTTAGAPSAPPEECYSFWLGDDLDMKSYI